MTQEQNEQFKQGIFLVMAGYFFVSFNFDFNLNDLTIPLIPNIAGWFFFYKALEQLEPLQATMGLLKPSCVVLGVFSVDQFLPQLSQGIYDALPLISVFSTVVVVYFHFQLLTDLASLIQEEDPSQKLLKARTVMVLSSTLARLALLMPQGLTILVTGGLLVYLATVLYVLWVLYGVYKGADASRVG